MLPNQISAETSSLKLFPKNFPEKPVLRMEFWQPGRFAGKDIFGERDFSRNGESIGPVSNKEAFDGFFCDNLACLSRPRPTQMM